MDANPEIAPVVAFESAIQHEWMDVAKTLLERDPVLATPEIMRLAAASGNMELVRQLFSLSSCVLPWTVTDAARNSHTENVQYIVERVANCLHEHVMVGAATGGHVETVQYLHENYHQHCTPNALVEAARHGHLEVLQYLHANCSVTATGYLPRAAYSPNLEVVQFVVANFSAGDTSVTEAIAVAGRRRSDPIIEFLRNASG